MREKTQYNYTIVLARLRKKKKLKVVFLLINVDSWKLNSLYWSFKNDEKFNAIVIICPFISKGQSFLVSELNKAKKYCDNMGYDIFTAYDENKSMVIDAKKMIKPDIVFFTNPNNLTSNELLITNYFDALTCYIPYSFRIDTFYKYDFDNNLVNLTWKNFYESPTHKTLAEKYARNKGKNVVVLGYPFLDNYKDMETKRKVWRSLRKKRKKIIWGPHWTIKGYQNTGLDWSCFLIYQEVILKLAKEFESEIQIAIKPHPFLKETLSQSFLWGIEKTEIYFDKWKSIKNCQIVDGDYIDLFLESDALIHDSGSFMAEYLALNKQIAYTVNEGGIHNRFNEFGQILLSGHHLIYSETDLRQFIINVINNHDPLSDVKKEIIYNQNLYSNELVSEKIVKHIKMELM